MRLEARWRGPRLPVEASGRRSGEKRTGQKRRGEKTWDGSRKQEGAAMQPRAKGWPKMESAGRWKKPVWKKPVAQRTRS